MSFHTIIMPVNLGTVSAQAVNSALALAKAFDASLTGVYVHDTASVYNRLAYGDMVLAGAMDALREAERQSRVETRELEKEFRGSAQHLDFKKFDWKYIDGRAIEQLIAEARCSDLVLIPCGSRQQSGVDQGPDTAGELAITTGRPVLVLPAERAQGSLGRNILVAWNGTREAARAAHEALPLLHRADKVIVVTVVGAADEKETARQAAADMLHYLETHDIAASFAAVERGSLSIGRALLNYASKCDADLLCMGAYGHSRLREVVIGGATMEVLENPSVPVLLAH